MIPDESNLNKPSGLCEFCFFNYYSAYKNKVKICIFCFFKLQSRIVPDWMKRRLGNLNGHYPDA